MLNLTELIVLLSQSVTAAFLLLVLTGLLILTIALTWATLEVILDAIRTRRERGDL